MSCSNHWDLGVWFLFWSLAGSLLVEEKQNSEFHHPSRIPKHSYHLNHSRMHAPSSGTVAAVTFHLLIFVRRFSVCFGHFCWQMPVVGVPVLTKLQAFFSLQHRARYQLWESSGHLKAPLKIGLNLSLVPKLEVAASFRLYLIVSISCLISQVLRLLQHTFLNTPRKNILPTSWALLKECLSYVGSRWLPLGCVAN